MMLLDMRTIVFSYVVTDIVCMVVIVLLWQQSRKRFAGVAFWVFDFAFQLSALFLIVLRGTIPNWMSFVLANTLVIAGALLGYMGLSRFVGKKSFQIHNYILLAAFAFVHTYFTFVQPNQAARNLNISVGLLIICFQCAWLLLYRVESGIRTLTRGVGIVFGLYCLVNIVRIVEFFAVAHSKSDYLQSGTFEQLILVSNQMLFILLTYSLTLMFNKRLMLEITTQEEKFSKAFHSSPYAITITRLSDGQIIEVNEGFFNITGYQLADLREKTTLALHLWDRDEDRARVVNELASKGKVQEREFQFRKKSGERITGLFSAEIITVNNEKCVLSSINDITNRKETEETLEESEKYFKEITENSSDVIIITDKNGDIKYCSRSIERFTGYKPEELVGRSGFTFIHPDDVKRAVDDFGKAILAIDSAIPNAFRIVHKDGSARYFDGLGRNLLDNPAVAGFIMNIHDITERKQAETQREATLEALKESERQYRNLFENSLEGIYQTTPEGRLINVNIAFAKMFGYESSEEVVGAIVDIASQLYANPEERKKAINILREKGYLKDFECQMRRKDGTTFWTFINARFTENQDGMRYFEGFIIDITGRKQAEEEVLRLNAELEQQVAKRTGELRNSQLALLSIVEDLSDSNKKVVVTNQSLNALNKELEAFAYSVSHDLRAPLRSIDGFSLALLEDYQKKLDGTGRNYLEKVRTATQHMGNLIDDMLKLSRVTRFEFHPESIDLSKMVQSISDTFRNNNPNNNAKITIQKGIVIQGDHQLMQIALTNLMENAWKFTGKQKHPRIEFGATLEKNEKIFFIRDNGVGFDMSYVSKLFGAFQRLHTVGEFAGTGIGLATVQRIINRHEGKIWAEGEVGKGAVFYFTLP